MLKGELDVLTAPQLAAELIAQNGAARDLLIDLSDLTFIDSSGIYVLVRACAQNGTRVVCPPGNIRRVLDIVSFSNAARLYESLEEALHAPQKREEAHASPPPRLFDRSAPSSAHVRYRAEPRGTPDESRLTP
jgi:anti-sigma B factor antagonist